MRFSLKIQQFCSLSTSSAFQAWLYKYDHNLYSDFISKLHKSGGCSDNSVIMKNLLDKIVDNGGSDAIYNFLSVQFPFVINKTVENSTHSIFKDYIPDVLTYPHRIILSGENLESKVKYIVDGKLKYDYIIIDDVAYIEYLDITESSLVDKIPHKNWLVTAYKGSLK